MRDKLYFMYKTINIKNNKFYIGVHETTNLKDGYLGSGKRFKNSLYYHGKENFKREILEYFDNSKSMYDKEREIVNEELLKNPKCLNLVTGGKGGFSSKEHMMKCSTAGVNARLQKLKTNELYYFELKKHLNHQFELNIKLGKVVKFNGQNSCNWTGKKHSKETIEKMKISHNEIHKECLLDSLVANWKLYLILSTLLAHKMVYIDSQQNYLTYIYINLGQWIVDISFQ